MSESHWENDGWGDAAEDEGWGDDDGGDGWGDTGNAIDFNEVSLLVSCRSEMCAPLCCVCSVRRR